MYGQLTPPSFMETGNAKRIALLAAALSSFLAPFMISAVNIAIPTIAARFHASAVEVSWFATAYLLTMSMFLVPFGRIADIHGRKRIFIYGMFVYTSSSLFAAFSVSASMLIAARVVEGIGAAMTVGTGVAILTSVYPPQERGRVLGINVAAVYLGLSFGPFIGGFITDYLGWREVFLLNVPLGALIMALVIWKLKGEWAGARGEKFDLAGAAVYSVMLVLIIYGLSLLGEDAAAGAALVAAGALAVVMFARREARVKHPVLDISLFRHNTIFAFSNIAALINYSATFAVTFLLSLYLQYIKGYGPFAAGLILVPQPLAMTVLSPFAGRLSDRIPPLYVASAGMALTTISLFSFIFLREGTALALIVADLVLLGVGFALFSSPNTNAIMSAVGKRFYGVAAGTVGTMRTIGQSVSMGVALSIFAVILGNRQIAVVTYPLLLKSVRISFIVFSAACFAGIFASLARGKE